MEDSLSSLFGSDDRLQAGRRDANIYRFSNVRNAGTGIEESLRPLLAAILAAEELVAAFPRTPTQCALRIAPTTALLAALVCAPGQTSDFTQVQERSFSRAVRMSKGE